MKARILSCAYRWIRRRMIDRVYRLQERQGSPRDLEEAVEVGEQWLKRLPRWMYAFDIPPGIGVQLYDLEFPSPLTLSSFKDDTSVIDIWMHLGLGGACIKTVMKEPRAGNPRPRLQEVSGGGSDGLLNAMGLPGSGVEAVAACLPRLCLFDLGRPVGLSVGGSSLDEYASNFYHLARTMRGVECSCTLSRERRLQYYFEVNISCPNTPEGQQMAKHPRLLERLLDEMRSCTDKVVGVKLSPDMSNRDVLFFAERIRQFPRTYVNLGNTSYRTCGDVGLSPQAISVGGGGLSGPALYSRTLEMTMLVQNTGIPIIATGGVDCSRKVAELVGFGATLVGMATAVVQDMYCIPKINYELAGRGLPRKKSL